MDEGADFFAFDGESNGVRVAEVKDEDGQVVVQAKRECRGVHDAEALPEGVDEGDVVVFDGVRVLFGIFVVDAVDLGGFEDDVGIDLVSAQGGRGVGGEVGVTRAGDENNDAVFLQVANGATENEGFGDLIHRNRGLDAGADVHFLQTIHDRETVDDGGEHAHVVTRVAIDPSRLTLEAAEDITSADHDADFDAHFVNFFHLSADAGQHGRVDGIGAGAAQDFAAQFQDDTFIFCCG